MQSLSSPAIAPARREWLGVAIVTLIGALPRFWPFGRLGLTHFDEGIYALAASWSLMPKGLAGLDPSLISYAPPGYPILGGLVYAVLGPSDAAMILVSQCAGIATIPVIAWLGRRTFGAGAGFASAVFCALSGPHIAFSRMALTDASFLLAWSLAVGAGMRFLERPGLVRGLVLGIAVGLAQEFKYNGWLTGAIVIATAFLGVLIRPEDRKPGSIARTFGWGGLAAAMAWIFVWPWFSFVEAHGGYSALLRHQQRYLGGFRAWWPNLLTQADQALALSGSLWMAGLALALASVTPFLVPVESWIQATHQLGRNGRILVAIAFAGLGVLLADIPFWLGLLAFPWLLVQRSPSRRLVGIWWLTLGATSPFYHPYARLWLPFEAANWLLIGCLVAEGPALAQGYAFARWQTAWDRRLSLIATAGLIVLAGFGSWVAITSKTKRGATAQADLLAPSDSLRRAYGQLSVFLPDEVQGVQVLARPALFFYMTGRIPISRMARSDALLKPGNSSSWAVVDSALLRSEFGKPAGGMDRIHLERFARYWEVVQEFPNDLGLPALLDVDPDAARSSTTDRNCSLWLLRPRRPGGTP